MRLPEPAANPALAALIAGAGYPTVDRFAEAVNELAWTRLGVKLSYDHVSVKRWVGGSTCQYPELVAEVLSDAWGVPVPAEVVWPCGRRPPAHLQPWVAARTLDELGVFLRSDMLTRRNAFTAAIQATTGAAFIEPVARWLSRPTTGAVLDGRATEPGTGRIDAAAVARIEQATEDFAAIDAEVGGGMIREAAIGQLKYAVDLARDASYSNVVGAQLLTAIADLSAWIGWMSFDSGMQGPAQRYATYGLQAAHEAGTEDGAIRATRSLADLALMARSRGQHSDALRLVTLALERVPEDRGRYNSVRANLHAIRARVLCPYGPSALPEIRGALSLAIDMEGQSQHDEPAPSVARYWRYASMAELVGGASRGFIQLAEVDRRLAADTADLALSALAQRPPGFGRSNAFDRITVCHARFLAGEPDQAAEDGLAALAAAAEVPASARIGYRLRDLGRGSAPYQDRPGVRDFRDQLRLALRST